MNTRTTLLIFSLAVLAVFALLWGIEFLFPKTSASAIALVTITLVGLWIARPGWHILPKGYRSYWLLLFSLLLASAVIAAWLLALLKIPLPYDFTTLNLVTAIPGILVITGIEELLFRQIMYRWLEEKVVPLRITIVAIALAFGWGHLGPIFIGSTIGVIFFWLQSVYMVWVGILLGEIRRITQSWMMCWLGHFTYNLLVLYVLSLNVTA